MGASNKYTADEQLEQIAFYWINLHDGQPAPLTVRILSRDRDVYLDLGGGNRIPKISERQARSVAELRAAGVGVDRVLLLHDGSRGQQRPVPGRADHARPAGGARRWCRRRRPDADPLTGHGVVQHERSGRELGRGLTVLRSAEGRRGRQSWNGCAGRVRPDHPAAAGRVAGGRACARWTSALVTSCARPLPRLPGGGAGHPAGSRGSDAQPRCEMPIAYLPRCLSHHACQVGADGPRSSPPLSLTSA